MPKVYDLIGKKFGHLTVLSKINPPKATKYSITWECRCDCGGTSFPRTNDLLSGKTDHCGANVHRGTHRRSHTKEYNSWRQIKARCINPNHAAYFKYGARGIKMCDRWLNSFQNFLDDMGYAPENSKKYSVERNDNNGNYEPKNCRWATYDEQANNRRTSHLVAFNGQSKTLAQWCKELKIPYHRTCVRINRSGMTPEEAFANVRYSNAGDRSKLPT